MLVSFTNLSFMESSFLCNRQLQVVLVESIHKNTQLMLEFLKALFLVLHFSSYTLMIFLMMLCVVLLTMLVILLSAQV